MKISKIITASIIIFLLIVSGVIIYFVNPNLWKNLLLNRLGGGENGYKAIFLTNGQVFFGQVNRGDTGYITIKSIYYLRQGSQLSEGNPNAKIELIKRGKELHGPEDFMMITRDHILYMENVGPESTIGKAIKQSSQTGSLSFAKNPTAATPSPKPTILGSQRLVRVKDNDVGFLRVRKDPSSQSEEIGKVDPGTDLKVIQENPNWFQIEYEVGKVGWVSKAFVAEVKE